MNLKTCFLLLTIICIVSSHDTKAHIKIGHNYEEIGGPIKPKTKLDHLSAIERRIRDFELELRKKRLAEGDQEIKRLTGLLKQVTVFKVEKELPKEEDNQNIVAYMLTHPDEADKAKKKVEEQTKNLRTGKSLQDVENVKSNPFKGLTELQEIIDTVVESSGSDKSSSSDPIRAKALNI